MLGIFLFCACGHPSIRQRPRCMCFRFCHNCRHRQKANATVNKDTAMHRCARSALSHFASAGAHRPCNSCQTDCVRHPAWRAGPSGAPPCPLCRPPLHCSATFAPRGAGDPSGTADTLPEVCCEGPVGKRSSHLVPRSIPNSSWIGDRKMGRLTWSGNLSWEPNEHGDNSANAL